MKRKRKRVKQCIYTFFLTFPQKNLTGKWRWHKTLHHEKITLKGSVRVLHVVMVIKFHVDQPV